MSDESQSSPFASFAFPVGPFVWITLLLSAIVITSLQVRQLALGVSDAYGEWGQMAELKGVILTYDEVLTMSAHMAVSTEDPVWEARYRLHEPLLEAAIEAAIQLDQDALVVRTREANDRLVSIENQAFEHVRAGEATRGRELLQSQAYLDDKALYTRAITQAMDRLSARNEQTVRAKEAAMLNSVLVVLGLVVLALITWGVLALNLIRWRSMLLLTQEQKRHALEVLQDVNVTLEERIRTRTAQVQAKHDQVRTLATQMIRIEERERERLSEVLHDELQQVLVVAQLRLGSLAQSLPRESSSEVHDIASLLRSGVRTTRTLASTLSPITNDESLEAAVRQVCQLQRDSLNIDITVDLPENLPEVAGPVVRLVARATSEMLFNAAKHSHVQEATLSIRDMNDGMLTLSVEDRGRGLAPSVLESGRGLGLRSIRQKAEWLGGSLQVFAVEPSGTKVVLSLPHVPRVD